MIRFACYPTIDRSGRPEVEYEILQGKTTKDVDRALDKANRDGLFVCLEPGEVVVKASGLALTEAEIDSIVGGYWDSEEAIQYWRTEDFANAVIAALRKKLGVGE